MKNLDRQKTSPNRLVYWMRGFVYLTATVLALVGFFLLSTFWATRNSTDWWLGWHDPLFGINDRKILAIGGIFNLAVATYLFAGRNNFNRSLAILWAGMNQLIYFAGIRIVEPVALPNTERFFGWRLRIQPTAVDFRWKLLIAYLLVTGIALLALTFWDSKKLTKDAWLLDWQKKRSERPKEKQATKKPQPAEDYTKIVCSHCGQKIAFPSSRLGENIACPHCAASILLQTPGQVI